AVGAAIHRLYGAFVAPRTVVRALVAGACGYAVAHFVPHTSAVGAAAACVLGALGYAIALALVRELGRDDLALVQRVLARRARCSRPTVSARSRRSCRRASREARRARS